MKLNISIPVQRLLFEGKELENSQQIQKLSIKNSIWVFDYYPLLDSVIILNSFLKGGRCHYDPMLLKLAIKKHVLKSICQKCHSKNDLNAKLCRKKKCRSKNLKPISRKCN